MSSNTEIEWATHTFNPWRGCSKISAGCKHCYAERMDARGLWSAERAWGEFAPRIVASEVAWKLPGTWQRAAERNGAVRVPLLSTVAAGAAPRVFCGSMCDVGEDRSELDATRERLIGVIKQTWALRWLLLSKRPENLRRFFWPGGLVPTNVWMGTSVENQDACRRVEVIKRSAAVVRFLSVEPLLERVRLPLSRIVCGACGGTGRAADPPIEMGRCAECGGHGVHGIDWVIVGGESGPGARPCAVEWIADVVMQCAEAGVPVFVKQLGSRPVLHGGAYRWSTGKGGDPAEWAKIVVEASGVRMSAADFVRELPEGYLRAAEAA